MKNAAALMIALIVSLSGCGQATTNPKEAAAIALVQRLGGKVELEGEGNDRTVVKVYLHNTAVKNEDMETIGSLGNLRNLFLGNARIGDAGVEHLKNVSELVTLSLNSTLVTDAGLESLTGLSKLKTLNLQETKVSEAGALKLKQAIPGLTIAR